VWVANGGAVEKGSALDGAVGIWRGRRGYVLVVAVGAVSAAIALGAFLGNVFGSIEANSVDARFSVRGASGRPKQVVVVAIDSATFSAFHNLLQWPFPRRYEARVIDAIAAGHPKAIAVDIQFTEPTDRADDDALIEAVARAGHVVLASSEVNAQGGTNVFGGSSVVNEIGAHVGSSLMPVGADGVIRRVSNSVDGLTTFGIAAAAVALGQPVPPPRGGSHWIDFAGPPGTVLTYSFSSVYLGRVAPGAFRGKVVVVGPSAPVLQDVHATAAGSPMAGAEIQANVINTALHGFPLRSAPRWLNALVLVLLAMLPVATVRRVGAIYTLLYAVAAGMLFAVAVQVAFDHGLVLAFVYPLLGLSLSTIGSIIVLYDQQLRAMSTLNKQPGIERGGPASS
jgi:CHASE2 domain-containing sensor protein